MEIFTYLNKIKSQQPINFDSFCKLLNKSDYDNQKILTIFKAEKLSRLNYQVSVINEQLFSQLVNNFPEYTISDRITAAHAGNSHKHPVSQSIIILWSYQQSHPVVILNNNDKINTPVNLGRHLLIIENQENFVQKQRTLDFLKQQFPKFSDEQLDIAHGSGNSITNRLNKVFFNHYQQIDCLLDLDIGGLKIFTSLLNLTHHSQLNFLLPLCADELLKNSKRELKHKHFSKLNKYINKYPSLHPAISLIKKHNKFLEQELYL
jgi:hypothetical protein